MEEPKATEANTEAIAPQAVVETPEDSEARYKRLEEEKENYRKAYLKESEKNRIPMEELDEDGKMAEIARRVMGESRLAEIAREQDSIIQKALKENKELKLAQLNKTTTTPSAAIGTHSESVAVKDTMVTPDQEAFFKSKGWDAATIERYKKNLQKNSR